MKYNNTLVFIKQALETLSYDESASDARNYLIMAANSLENKAKRTSRVNEARKKYEEIGKKKHQDWLESLKKNKKLNLD